MNEPLPQRVRAAASAGWWTILIGGIWITVGWLIWLAILRNRDACGWMLELWGGEPLGWSDVQSLVLRVIALMKVILLAMLLIVIWLTFWARGLRRGGT